MPVRAHLGELRRRVIIGVIGVALGAVAGWILYDRVLDLLMDPLAEAAAAHQGTVTLNFATVAASFDVKLQASVFLGFVVSCPWWLYQVWAFISPALSRKERWYAVGFLAAAVPLFLGGAFLAWWVLPTAVELLTQFTPSDAVNLLDAEAYLGFVLRLMGAFAIAFLVPVVMVALSFAGVVGAGTWARGWRWAVFISFLFAAIASPTPDVMTMFVLALPMCALYAAAVLIAHLHARRTARRAARLPQD